MIFDLTIYPSSTICSHGFLLDSFLFFKSQILFVASSFFYLRRIKQISSYLDDASLKIFVLSRLGYCNSFYYNLPKSTFYSLTKAFNSEACLASHTSEFSHISPSLVNLQWLSLYFRFSFKICSLMYKIFLLHFLIFLTSYYLINVLASDPLLALSFSLSLSFLY